MLQWTALPNDPLATDYLVEPLGPHAYSHIAWSGDTIWTVCAGTCNNDPQDNDAVIRSSRIEWTWLPWRFLAEPRERKR